MHNGLPWGTLPLGLNVKPQRLCSGKQPDPVLPVEQGNNRTLFYLWMAARKKKLTHPLSEAGHSRGYLKNLWPFYFTSSSPPPLCAIKETGIQTPIKSYSFASTAVSEFGLLCGEQRELGFGNKLSYGQEF